MARRITLQTWITLTYGDDAPTMDTARKWCRDGKIQPQPKKHGREYYCSPDAEYVDGSTPTLVQRIIRRGSSTAQHT